MAFLAALSPAEWILIIKGVISFPKDLLALVKILQKTPSERHAELLAKMNAESDAMAASGRPQW